MQYHVEVPLNVPAARAWAQLADLPSWPDWTPTVESLNSQTARPQVGSEVTIRQPGRSAAHYVIDLVEDGRRFRWGSNRGGVRQAADHLVEPAGESACTATLTFTMTGPIGAVLGALGAGKIRAMVNAEAQALTPPSNRLQPTYERERPHGYLPRPMVDDLRTRWPVWPGTPSPTSALSSLRRSHAALGFSGRPRAELGQAGQSGAGMTDVRRTIVLNKINSNDPGNNRRPRNPGPWSW